MSRWDADELRALQTVFLEEAGAHLEAAAQALDDGDVASLLRALHTLKGAAGSVELPLVSQAAHAFEDRVIAARGLAPDGLRDMLDELQALVDDARLALTAPLPPAPPSRERRAIERVPLTEGATVRVEVERIDELADGLSELVFDRARLARRLVDVEAHARALGDRALISEVAALKDCLEGLSRTSATLQDRIRRVRRVEIGRLFARLSQPVRELARRLGKQVELELSGAETEIDKALVERIAEPLLHLLRNAVAHGIERPSVRRAAGKPAVGVVTLGARQLDDAIEITVSDDGRGVDLAGVKRALVAAGRVDAEAADALDERSLTLALFEAGISTRVQADDVAGRGIGLDAVRVALQRLSGTVDVVSRAGRGVSFTVRLPVVTVVQQAFLFKVGGQVYAVPAARVEETIEIAQAVDPRVLSRRPVEGETGEPDGERPRSDRTSRTHRHGEAGSEDASREAQRVRRGSMSEAEASSPVVAELGDEEVVRVNGRTLPLLRLGALLGIPAPASTTRRSALVLTVEGFTFAATCDKLIGARQIVARRLPPLLSHLRLYAGATISGAGKVQLILDVARLAELARQGVHKDRPAEAAAPPCVLVVDDSRAIQRAAALILGAGGFATETVSDGFLAWERLQDRAFHALVTDLEMPRCDGWELIERVRRAPELGALPIVVVSSRADQERERAIAIGADVVVKKPLGKKTLLDAVGGAVSGRARARARRE